MATTVELAGTAGDCLLFSVWISGNCYECPVPRALVYELCRSPDPKLDRIDAFIALKEKVGMLVEQWLAEGKQPEAGDAEPQRRLH